MDNQSINPFSLEENIKFIAEQLRKPSGEYASKIGEKMNESNFQMNIKTIESLVLEAQDNVLEIGMGNGFFILKKWLMSPLHGMKIWQETRK